MTADFDECFIRQYDIELEKGNGRENTKCDDLGNGIGNN
jgi:hypothetical protein